MPEQVSALLDDMDGKEFLLEATSRKILALPFPEQLSFCFIMVSILKILQTVKSCSSVCTRNANWNVKYSASVGQHS